MGLTNAGRHLGHNVPFNFKRRIVVGYRRERSANGHFNSQFFLQFPLQTFLRLLPVIDLSARELPLERQTHGLTSLSREHLAVFINYGTSNVNAFQCNPSHRLVHIFAQFMNVNI